MKTSHEVENTLELVIMCSYHPIPMVFAQAKGTCIWDPEGKKYIDFLSAYSAVNQVLKPYERTIDLFPMYI